MNASPVAALPQDGGARRRRAPPMRGRHQQILEMLARQLESKPGDRITTAALAQALGVSEAALYRHFPSKARMFEGLIEFAEESIFGLIARIMAGQAGAPARCEQIVALLLGFAERNAGISRVLGGDALVGENERLRQRVAQFFERLEAQLRQVLREAVVAESPRLRLSVNAAAGLLMAMVEGRVAQYIRSGFRRQPTEHWAEQWQALANALFDTA